MYCKNMYLKLLSLSCDIPHLLLGTHAPLFPRGTSSYVSRVRWEQKLKQNDKLPEECYVKGSYLICSKNPKKVLVKKSFGSSGRAQLGLFRADHEIVSKMGVDLEKESVLLGIDSNSTFQFGLEVVDTDSVIGSFGKNDGKFIGIRASLFLLSEEESSRVSQACSLLSWRKMSVHCSSCGNVLSNFGSSSSKYCSSEVCIDGRKRNHQHPPINPVGISIVSDESHAKALLVRQPSHPPGMFTCIAGFIEVGESMEDNVKREVAEEVGMDVIGIEYVTSQHWAFPSSRLMLGCHAIVRRTDDKVSIDTDELEDAAWFTPEEIRESLRRTNELAKSKKGSSMLFSPEDDSLPFHWVPPRGALANTLIRWWLKKYHP